MPDQFHSYMDPSHTALYSPRSTRLSVLFDHFDSTEKHSPLFSLPVAAHQGRTSPRPVYLPTANTTFRSQRTGNMIMEETPRPPMFIDWENDPKPMGWYIAGTALRRYGDDCHLWRLRREQLKQRWAEALLPSPMPMDRNPFAAAVQANGLLVSPVGEAVTTTLRGAYTDHRTALAAIGEMTRSVITAIRTFDPCDTTAVASLRTLLRTLHGMFDPAAPLHYTARQGTRNRVVEAIVEVFEGSEYLDTETFLAHCPHCEEYYFPDETEWCETHGGDRVCDRCRDAAYVFSELMDTYLLEGDPDTQRVYYSPRAYNNGEPDDFVSRTWALNSSNNLYAWDGCFVDEDTYGDLNYDLNYDDDSDSDSETPRWRRDGLHEYHSSPQRGSGYPITCSDPRYPPLGLEIEVYAPQRKAAVDALRALPYGRELMIERDGSLNHAYGMEIITNPWGVAEWRERGPEMLAALSATGTVGYNVPDDCYMYGIHVNMGRNALSPLQEARMMLFLCAAENRTFAQCIAQRADVYSADVGIGRATGIDMSHRSPAHERYPTAVCGGLYYHTRGSANKKIYGRGKYCPINWAGERAEFRIFNSTLHVESFLKNIEFVWALYEWTSPIAATGSSWRHEDFLVWLGSRPNVRKDFPNLLAFLCREKHYAHGSKHPIHTGGFGHLLICKKPEAQDVAEV